MRRFFLLATVGILAAVSARAQAPAAAPAPQPTKAPAVIAPVPESPGQSMIEQEESSLSGRDVLVRSGRAAATRSARC